jgi:hypothetical protein
LLRLLGSGRGQKPQTVPVQESSKPLYHGREELITVYHGSTAATETSNVRVRTPKTCQLRENEMPEMRDGVKQFVTPLSTAEQLQGFFELFRYDEAINLFSFGDSRLR